MQSSFLNTGHISGITAGPPILDAGDDEEIYNLIESSWLALRGEKNNRSYFKRL